MSNYPKELDLFQLKRNAVSQEDPNGDYVMADDVNDLQDAISAIQEALGTNPQGNAVNVADRITKAENATPLRVPPVLIYLGSSAGINGATTVDEAVLHYLGYDHVVLNSDANTKDIIQKTKVVRSVKFYGYVDCGTTTANLSVSQIGINIQTLVNAGFNGIYCGNFGWDKGNTRDRQNKILDAVHQHGIPAFLHATNPDDVFSSGYSLPANPNWTKPNIQTGDIYHYAKFAVDTTGATPYIDLSSVKTMMDKLYGYRTQFGAKVFATATIGSSVAQSDAQSYFEYAHAAAVLFSVDGFYAVDEGSGSVSTSARSYTWIPFIGAWHAATPAVKITGTEYSRKTSFGKILVDAASHTFEYQGVVIPSKYIQFLANSLNGSSLLDNSVPDIKISSYDGDRLIAAINTAAGTEKIDLSKIMTIPADILTGNIPSGLMQANVIQAINAYIGSARISAAQIGEIEAGKITAGTIDAARISGSVISAINSYIGSAVIGQAKIGNLDASKITTGDIAADRIKTSVIDAVNAHIGSAVIDQAKIGSLDAAKITAGDISSDRMRANVVNAINLYASSIQATDAKISNAVIGELTADHIKANVIEAVNASIASATINAAKIGVLTATNIGAETITSDKIQAEAITTDKIAAGAITSDKIIVGSLDGDRVKARTIDANKIKTGSITAVEIAAGTITANEIAANAITSDKISAGAITSDHITTGGLDAQIVNIYNSTTGQVLIGGGFLRVDGLDVGVVQSDNLVMNGLFLTASSGYGLIRDNPAGEVMVGSNTSAPGAHQVWKIDAATGVKLNEIDIAGKKPYGIAIDETGAYAYVTVQGDDSIVQIDLANNIPTGNFLKSGMGPGVIKYTGDHLTDHKHLFALGTDIDDMSIPDALMVVDAPLESINGSLYMHHQIPLGNKPYDFVMDDDHKTYVTMADQGDIIVLDMSNFDSMKWKVTGRIPITAYGTDTYHGGLPGDFGLNATVGGSSAASYQSGSGGQAGHSHGGYGSADGSLKKYEPHGIAQSTDARTLYVIDHTNGELVIVDKDGTAPYNAMTGTRETGNLGTNGTPMDPTADFTSGTRDYTNANGETNYVRYRIPVGDSPEFVEVHDGKIFITLSGSGKVAILDEQPILDQITDDRTYYANFNPFVPFKPLPTFAVRYIDVGSKPGHVAMDETNMKLYVVVNGQNQIAVIDMTMETVDRRINVGANPKGLALSADGSSLYVVNHGGAGTLTFVYPKGPYIGDAYLGLEGMINHHGAMGWMPDRSNWIYEADGKTIRSSSTVEFRINEPFLNEGGYVRLAAQGKDAQLAEVQQDIINVTNYSDGTSKAGTWYRYHNGSINAAIANSSSPNFSTVFEIEEFVPKFVVLDNQQTSPFTPSADGVNEVYSGLEYSIITNRASGGAVTSSAAPTAGVLDLITNDIEASAEYVTLPSGLQSVTIDLGKKYMIGKINPCHMYDSMRTYHGTKTEVSEDGVSWITVYDSTVSGEYQETMWHETHQHWHYGKPIIFPARPVRYVRDWANGWTDTSVTPNTSGTENTWAEIQVYGDWEVEETYVYPPRSEKAGQQVATNGRCFVATDVLGAYIAVDIQIEFSSWSWMTFIAGPEFGTMTIEMPSLMSSPHFVAQDWPYITNIAHQHVMMLSPSLNIKEDLSKGIKAGKHRIVLKQSSGRVTLDRMRFDDYQYYTKSSTLIPNTAGSTYRRYKIVAEQARGYVGVGRQTTEGAYDEVRKNPDDHLPDGSVPLKYRFRVRTELNPTGNLDERGIAYVTSAIMETGKLSSHWRMSQAGDVFPGTRIESWDPNQPHNTGIQNHHLAFGSVRGNAIMPGAIMNHHVNSYARIAEHKLDLNFPTHEHGRYVPAPPESGMKFVLVSNKGILDMIEGWGTSGTANAMARADHTHSGMVTASGTPAEGQVPIMLSGSVAWGNIPWSSIAGKPDAFAPSAHTHTSADISDLPALYYDKSQIDAKLATAGGDIYSNRANVLSGLNTFTNTGLSIKIQPSSAPAPGTVLLQLADTTGISLVTMSSEGDVVIKGNLQVQGQTTYSGTQVIQGDYTIEGNLIAKKDVTLGDPVTGVTTIKGELRAEGNLIQKGKYLEVMRFNAFGEGDIPIEVNTTDAWETITTTCQPFKTQTDDTTSPIPAIPANAQRYYRLLVMYSNASSGNTSPFQIVEMGTTTEIAAFTLPTVLGTLTTKARPYMSPVFQTAFTGHCDFQIKDGNGGGTQVKSITVVAYDYYT